MIKGTRGAETSMRTYASRVFKESSVGMVSSLAQTTSVRRKIFKVTSLILCLSGFLYQSGEFLQMIFQYPTSVHIEVLRPKIFDVPGFTFCNNNGINRRTFCEKFPDRCVEPSEAFCKEYEEFCGKNKTLVPKHFNVSLEDILELSNTDYLVEFIWYFENFTGPHLRFREDIDLPITCYSLYDRVNNSLLPHQERVNKLNIESITKLLFKVQEDEMFLPGYKAGIFFAIHSPFQAVNPYDTGIFMKSGRSYDILISLEEEILLEKPYATNCTNYTEIWEKNNRTGPRIRNMCYEKCMAEVSLKCFNCVMPWIMFPTNERYCPLDGVYIWDGCGELFDRCDMNCGVDCSQTKYGYTVKERFRPKFDRFGNKLSDLENNIAVDIYFERDDVIVRKHSPKYMTVEVFSSIGGFIGCWMGFNLLDITDIFESLFRIILHLLKKKKYC